MIWQPEIGLARIEANRADEINRLDTEGLAFHEKVREGYLKLAQEDPERIRIVDASQPLEDVIEATWAILKELLGEK